MLTVKGDMNPEDTQALLDILNVVPYSPRAKALYAYWKLRLEQTLHTEPEGIDVEANREFLAGDPYYAPTERQVVPHGAS